MNVFWWWPWWLLANAVPPGPSPPPISYGTGIVYRPGDSAPEIRTIKAFMRAKFAAYAGALADTELYDQELVTAVIEMQRRYGLGMTGVLDYGTQVKMGYAEKPVLLTVHGYLGAMDFMQPADTARALLDYYQWQPVGYDSRSFPLGIGARDGAREVKRLINDVYPGRKFALCGISLGSIVVSDVLDAIRSGDMAHRRGDFLGGVAFANPRREAGVWSGHDPDPGGEGIAGPFNLKNTPANWQEYAHAGDIYAAKPLGEPGEPYHLVYTLILEKWDGTVVSLIDEAADLIARPIPEVATIVNAVLGAIGFFTGGQTPHIDLPIDGAVAFLRGLLFDTTDGGTVTTPQPTTKAKAWTALVGAGLTALLGILQQVAPVLPPVWGSIVTGLLAVLTVVGVHQVPNQPK